MWIFDIVFPVYSDSASCTGLQNVTGSCYRCPFCIGQTVVHKAGLYAVDNICGIFILVGNIKNMDGFSAF